MRKNKQTYNVEYYRRLAKKNGRELNIPHYRALDIEAKKIGFSNWKHFIRNANDFKILVKDTKLDPYRNLLIAATNKLIEGKHISLRLENINEDKERGHVFLNLFGYKSVIIWRNIGRGELTISVWWKYDHSKHPQANLKANAKESFNLFQPLANKSHYKKFVGVTVSCWLERKSGKYIQGKNRERLIDIYTRRGELELLKNTPVQKPNGYESSGRFYF